MAKVLNIDPIRVLIADDERLVREILSQELGNDPSIEVVGEATLGELAQQFSEGAEKDTDGIVGPISCEQIPPALRQVIVSAKIGIVMPPIFLDSWAAIVRVEKITPSSCMDEEMEQKLIDELFNNWKARAIREAKSNLKPWFP